MSYLDLVFQVLYDWLQRPEAKNVCFQIMLYEPGTKSGASWTQDSFSLASFISHNKNR